MKFLEGTDGGKSSTRLIFVVGSVWNMVLCSYLVFDGIEAGALVATFSAIEGVFVGSEAGTETNGKQKAKCLSTYRYHSCC
jgi:hypothetical protein